jgi:hypothetical protein
MGIYYDVTDMLYVMKNSTFIDVLVWNAAVGFKDFQLAQLLLSMFV